MAWSVTILGRFVHFHKLTFLVGDLAYADAWLKEEQGGYVTPLNVNDGGAEYDKILNEFYDEIEVLSQDRPYMVAAGMFSILCMYVS